MSLLNIVMISMIMMSCEKDNPSLVIESNVIHTLPQEPVIKVNRNINNYYQSGDTIYQGQGIAYHQGILYRLYNTGYCSVYNVENLLEPEKVGEFALGSHMDGNHSNAAQIEEDDDGKPIIYIAGLKGKCFVERISEQTATLIQTISIVPMSIFNNSIKFNMICGDDGYLWLFGEDRSQRKLFFGKARKPSLSEGNVTLKEEDILEYWSEDNYIYSQSVWQGGMVCRGKLYFVFGTPESRRHITIYDTRTKRPERDIDLNEYVTEEPEDCVMIGDVILLGINGGKGYYIIRPELF